MRTMIAMALALVCGRVCAQDPADTISGPFTTSTPVPSTRTDWSSSLSFPQFDSSLGTLMSVTLDLSGSLSTTITVTNTDSENGCAGNAKTEVQIAVQDAGLNLSAAELVLISPAYDYSLQEAGISGPSSSGLLTETGNDGGNTYTAPAVLSEFTGPGTIGLPASTSTQALLANSGGYAVETRVTDAALTGSVTYDYTPAGVPEPSTLALLGVGVVVLLGYVWRNR
jgi:hypothetical protein